MKSLMEDFFDNLGIGEETQIRDWLRDNNIRNYTINNDLTIDVDDNVIIQFDDTFIQFPEYIQFNKVNGDFILESLFNLKTLRGCPKVVTRIFEVSNCTKLKNLDGCPEKCHSLNCYDNNNLRTLTNMSNYDIKNLRIMNCPKLNSLKNSPKKLIKFLIKNCPKIKSLIGCPKEVDVFYWDNCGINPDINDIVKYCKINDKYDNI